LRIYLTLNRYFLFLILCVNSFYLDYKHHVLRYIRWQFQIIWLFTVVPRPLWVQSQPKANPIIRPDFRWTLIVQYHKIFPIKRWHCFIAEGVAFKEGVGLLYFINNNKIFSKRMEMQIYLNKIKIYWQKRFWA